MLVYIEPRYKSIWERGANKILIETPSWDETNNDESNKLLEIKSAIRSFEDAASVTRNVVYIWQRHSLVFLFGLDNPEHPTIDFQVLLEDGFVVGTSRHGTLETRPGLKEKHISLRQIYIRFKSWESCYRISCIFKQAKGYERKTISIVKITLKSQNNDIFLKKFEFAMWTSSFGVTKPKPYWVNYGTYNDRTVVLLPITKQATRSINHSLQWQLTFERVAYRCLPDRKCDCRFCFSSASPSVSCTW